MLMGFFQKRRTQGKLNEEHYKKFIEDDIKEDLNNGKYNALFDFENDNFKIELKTRECVRFQYPTTIIGYVKILKGLEFLKEDKRVIFYFGFKTDGLYKFELNEENHKDFKVSNIGCRYRKINNVEKQHIEIPVDVLEFVCNECPLQGDYTKLVSEVH